MTIIKKMLEAETNVMKSRALKNMQGGAGSEIGLRPRSQRG